MKTVFYKKVGRRYVPISEYDSEWNDSFRSGCHLIMCYPGGQSRRHNIEPNYAAMIAAGRVAEDVISAALIKASDLRMQRSDRDRKLTPEQKAAWENLVKEFGESASRLEWPSAKEAAEKAVEAMAAEAEKLMQNPAVKNAYEEFLLICKLTQEQKSE